MAMKNDLKTVLAIVSASSGGVGKSFIAQIVHEMIKGPEEQNSVFCASRRASIRDIPPKKSAHRTNFRR